MKYETSQHDSKSIVESINQLINLSVISYESEITILLYVRRDEPDNKVPDKKHSQLPRKRYKIRSNLRVFVCCRRDVGTNCRQALNNASDRENVRSITDSTDRQHRHIRDPVNDHIRLHTGYIDDDVSYRGDDVMRVGACDVSSSVDGLVVSAQHGSYAGHSGHEASL